MGPVVHPLDNPVWSSLTGSHGDLAEMAEAGPGHAGRYQRDVCPFAGLADPSDPDCWAALDVVLEGRTGVLIIDPADVPASWEVTNGIPGVQMDGSGLEPAVDAEVVSLAPSDVPEMLELIDRTRPGPFLPRTIEMGDYIGLRRHGSLVAMAGERLRPSGWAEVSAVCTAEAFRGQGLATRLVKAVAVGIRSRGEIPFLHSSQANVNAIRLYESIGFRLRRTVSFTFVRRARPPSD